MKFVDRIEEAARLKDALERERASLVVMYGRRRLGKSTLIKRVLSDTDVYFLADRSEGQHQRALLAKVIAQMFPDFDKLTYPDWESMFRAVNYRTDKRFTLCLDEFPYLVEQSPELPSVLQKLVDEKQLKYNEEHGITPQQIKKAKNLNVFATNEASGEAVLSSEKFTSSTPRPYVEQESTSTMAADPIVQYMSRKQLEKSIERTKKLMQEAAKKLDFIEAAQYRDEVLKMEELLKEKDE